MFNNLKLQKGLAPITIILIVVGIIAIVGGGFYAWQKSTKPSITLLSPNGGEIWTIGSTHTIRWTSQNIPQTDKIALHIRRVPPPPLPETGQEFDPIIFIELENTGSVDWTISDMYPVGNYIIEVNSYPSIPVTKSISDESDASFRIEFSSDEIADWKVYRNVEYGFEIKYPVDWWVAGETGAGREGVLHLFSVNIQKGKWGPPGELCMGCPGLFISIYNRDFFKGLGLVESSYWDSGMDVMIADYSAKKVLVKGENNVEEFFYILQDNNYDYKIEPSVPGIGGAGVNLEVEVNKVIPEFYQILSTFKFIEK